MKNVHSYLEKVTDALCDMTSSDLIVGEKIELGELTLVPLAHVSVALGGGLGEGSGDYKHKSRHKGTGSGTGGAGGGGAKVRPVAVAVFGPEGVEIINIPGKASKIEKLLDSIPDLIEKVKDKVESGKDDESW